jgi:hypothetical protein
MTPKDCPKQSRWRSEQAIAGHFGIGCAVRFDIHAK